MNSTKTPDISLIVPCHNEAGNVEPFLERASEVFGPRSEIAFEVVFVDDGSTDGTLDALKGLVARHRSSDTHVAERIRVVSFSRNFGKEAALYAGMKEADGDTMCFIDADLQQDPQIALEMYDYLVTHEDYDVVAAYQENRSEGRFMSWAKRRFYKAFNATSNGVELPENMSDFRVFTRQVAEALLSMPERYRFSKGLFAWIGFNTHAVPYTAQPRHAGESSWGMRSLFSYAYLGFTSFSTWPLKVLRVAGGLIAAAAIIYFLFVLIKAIVIGDPVPGFPTLACLILFFGGFQLFALGLIGDYLARDFIEGKHRPLYIVKRVISTDDENPPAQALSGSADIGD